MSESVCSSFVTFSSNLSDSMESGLSSLSSNNGSHKKLADIFVHYFKHNLYTDVVIKVSCGDSYINFPCHRLVLSMRSPVFASKLADKEPGYEMQIRDVSPSPFEALLRYCYGLDKVLYKNRDDVSFLLKVFKAAKKYKMSDLAARCCERLSLATPDVYNVFELLDAANMINSEGLKLECHKVLESKTKEILKLRDTCSIPSDVVDIILNMKHLTLDSEYDLIDWLFEWGNFMYKSDEKIPFLNFMAPYLSRINLTSISPNQFGLLAKKYEKYFDEKDISAIFMNIVLPGSKPMPSWCAVNEANRTFGPIDDSDSEDF